MSVGKRRLCFRGHRKSDDSCRIARIHHDGARTLYSASEVPRLDKPIAEKCIEPRGPPPALPPGHPSTEFAGENTIGVTKAAAEVGHVREAPPVGYLAQST